MLNFFDFEVYTYDWLVVIINPIIRAKLVIVNDKRQLEAYYNSHKEDIWISYNGRTYDQYIIKAILLDFTQTQIKELSDWIVKQKRKGWEYSSLFNRIQLYNYDVMSGYHGLKTLEAFMGNDIRETSVDFDIDRKLTAAEIGETIQYCTHDAEQLMEVFNKRKADFDAHISMLKTFKLPLSCISKTQAQLSARVLGASKKDHFDAWDIQIVNTLRIEKYSHIVDWFMDSDNHDYDKSLTVDVCGIPHQFGWGGLHGAIGEPVHIKGLILHVDVTSFYPSIMIEYDFLSRNVANKEAYKEIKDTRVALKNAGEKKKQAPYKIILNATYGICKDPSNSMYDPRQANNVCINGQLLLLDLLEHLEGHCRVIQSNTDGLIIEIPNSDEDFSMVDDICYEWESRTNMSLGIDIISEIYQKDVNNYLFIDEEGKVERKGAYVKELSDLDNDLPIVNKALVDYMTKGIPVEDTINDCDDFKMFQKVVKVSGSYLYGVHNGKKLTDKTFRVFASNDWMDSGIGKVKKEGGTVEKFANTPDHAFIVNESVNGLPVPDKLDKDYYIDLAKERLKSFGVR